MKYLSFFYVFFISLSLFCQDKNKRKYDDGEFIYEFYVSSKDNLKLKKELRYYWYENNRVKSSIYGVKGKVLNGRYVKTSLDSGEIMEEGSFFYGVKDGEWKEWNKGGGRKRNEVWKKGYLDGKYELYGDNSELLLTGIYKKGKKTGIWKEYKVGGVRVLRTWFKDVLDGRYKMYEKGKLIISGRYRKGLKHGVWINSKRKEKYRFDKGQLLDEKDKTFWSELFGKKKDTI